MSLRQKIKKMDAALNLANTEVWVEPYYTDMTYKCRGKKAKALAILSVLNGRKNAQPLFIIHPGVNSCRLYYADGKCCIEEVA